MDNAKDTKALSVSRAESGHRKLLTSAPRQRPRRRSCTAGYAPGQVRVNGAQGRRPSTASAKRRSRARAALCRAPARGRRESQPTPACIRSRTVQTSRRVRGRRHSSRRPSLPDCPYRAARDTGRSVASILAEERAHASFVPAPVHRLDKDTSGLLVAGKTYAAVRLSYGRARGARRRAAAQGISGLGGRSWEQRGPEELRDSLTRDRREQRVKASAHAESDEGRGKPAAWSPPLRNARFTAAPTRFCSSVSSPAARIRYACSLPRAGIPSWAIRGTATPKPRRAKD